MAVQVAVPGMRRVNNRVPDMVYAADVGIDGLSTVDIPALPAANATAILNAQSIASPNTTANPVAGFSPSIMGRYGRNVTIVASGTATSTVTIVGYDYLGQPMKEQLTLTSGTAVPGKKAFADVVRVDFANTAGITINVGTGNLLGVPYKVLGTAIYGELTSDATPTAGALVAGAATQAINSGDPRGTYAPNTVPNGTAYYRFTCTVDRNQLHGAAHVIV